MSLLKVVFFFVFNGVHSQYTTYMYSVKDLLSGFAGRNLVGSHRTNSRFWPTLAIEEFRTYCKYRFDKTLSGVSDIRMVSRHLKMCYSPNKVNHVNDYRCACDWWNITRIVCSFACVWCNITRSVRSFACDWCNITRSMPSFARDWCNITRSVSSFACEWCNITRSVRSFACD